MRLLLVKSTSTFLWMAKSLWPRAAHRWPSPALLQGVHIRYHLTVLNAYRGSCATQTIVVQWPMRCYLLDQGDYLVLPPRPAQWRGSQGGLFLDDYESAAGMVRDMMGLLKNLLALQALLSNHLTFIKPKTKKQKGVCSSLIGFVSLATFWRKWCGVLRWWYWCQQKSAKNWCSEGSQKDLPQEKLLFLDDLIFCVQIFAHLRWFKLQITWANYSELSPGHPQW